MLRTLRPAATSFSRASATLRVRVAASMQAAAALWPAPASSTSAWRRLGTPRRQLCLDFTLPTGQSFRWRKTGPGEYTGVIGQRVVQMRQEDDDVAWRVVARGAGAAADDADADAAALMDYFNLGVDLAVLYEEWMAADARFCKVAPHIPGARMLRQDPLECLFQFICSQNNHISRIHGMVERLCSTYGTPLYTAAPEIQPTSALPDACASSPVTDDDLSDMTNAGSSRKRPLREVQPLVGQQAADASSAATAVEEAGKLRRQGGEMDGQLEVQGSPSDLECQGVDLEIPSTPLAGASARQARARPPARPLKRGRSRSRSPPPGETAAAPDSGATALLDASPATAAAAPAVYYAFPTLQQLSAATEDELRSLGFGYRAKFITGAVAALLARPEGGEVWLQGLREVPAAEAAAALETLPGVGPKVAACVALFSLDKHDAIPVDTHVWQLATKYYAPRLAGKSLTKKLHAEVAAVFVERFGSRAGWAHSILFISELRQTQNQLQLAQAAEESG